MIAACKMKIMSSKTLKCSSRIDRHAIGVIYTFSPVDCQVFFSFIYVSELLLFQQLPCPFWHELLHHQTKLHNLQHVLHRKHPPPPPPSLHPHPAFWFVQGQENRVRTGRGLTNQSRGLSTPSRPYWECCCWSVFAIWLGLFLKEVMHVWRWCLDSGLFSPAVWCYLCCFYTEQEH